MKRAAAQKESEKIFVKAYDVASSYDLKIMRDMFVNNFSGKILNPNPLLAGFSGNRMAAVFDYGSIVFFNFSSAEIVETLDTVRGSAFRLNRRMSEDDFTLTISHELKMPEGTEELFIKEFNKDIALAVSVVLSRSVSMEYYETLVGDALANLEESISNLATKGKIQKDEKTLTKQVGFAISVEQELAYTLSAFDDPDIVWSSGKKIDELYKRMKKEFDLEDRVRAIQQKVSIISRSSTFIISRLEAQRSRILEWIIIVLILSEIVLAVMGKL